MSASIVTVCPAAGLKVKYPLPVVAPMKMPEPTALPLPAPPLPAPPVTLAPAMVNGPTMFRRPVTNPL
jgi:hypothetical protein